MKSAGGSGIPSMKELLRRYWFLVLLVCVIPVGTHWPEGGHRLRESSWAIRCLVAVTLSIAGFTLDTGRLYRQAANVKAIVLTLTSTYVVAPSGAFALASLWGPSGEVDEPLSALFLQSMMIMAAQAGTLASAMALTLVCRGNQELALVLTLISNTLTVFLTPLVLQIAIGAQVDFPVMKMVIHMMLVVLLPVAVGQVARRFLWRLATPVLPALRVIPQLLILVFVYAALSAAAQHLASDFVLAARFLGACISLHLFLLLWNYWTTRAVGLDAPSSTAVLFCGSQKTLPNGIYLWKEFFSGNPYGAVSLVLYHVFELIFDTLLVPFFQRRNLREDGESKS